MGLTSRSFFLRCSSLTLSACAVALLDVDALNDVNIANVAAPREGITEHSTPDHDDEL